MDPTLKMVTGGETKLVKVDPAKFSKKALTRDEFIRRITQVEPNTITIHLNLDGRQLAKAVLSLAVDKQDRKLQS